MLQSTTCSSELSVLLGSIQKLGVASFLWSNVKPLDDRGAGQAKHSLMGDPGSDWLLEQCKASSRTMIDRSFARMSGHGSRRPLQCMFDVGRRAEMDNEGSNDFLTACRWRRLG